MQLRQKSWSTYSKYEYIPFINLDRILINDQAIFVEGFIWAIEIPLVKISILLFYRRIFLGNQLWFKWAFWLTLVFSVSWGIATFIIVMVQCVPVPYF